MTASTHPSSMTIIAACEAEIHGHTVGFSSIGLPAPRSLLDVVRAMWSAQDALPNDERTALTRRDRLALELGRQASRGSMGSYHEPIALA